MSNKLNLNPIVLDTFDATFTLREKGVGPLTIRKVILISANSADRFALEDEDGNPVVVLKQNASLGKNCDWSYNGFTFANGLVFDHDDALNAGLGSGDYVLIYLK